MTDTIRDELRRLVAEANTSKGDASSRNMRESQDRLLDACDLHIPALLDTIDALEKRVRSLEKSTATAYDAVTKGDSEIVKLKAQIANLKSANAELNTEIMSLCP